ncbi:enoyl-CoA hydratase/isomerase family protein [Pseudomaricurvus alkylphenolicus]|uniref:enoyl-CoA hydratase/isomerase family protein n=1 Tax=Pseudomaricurvus alkylphenolicus TaxID=1306991 RepID=UPI00141FD1B8|nr:enoyl-CoA hydratase/isomerase family protein [Pseudomaricurvus alkylphenolicus]NIB37989.1 enoyl-CoA hydratase/isomerase family protein [Pseudomaricurvus alkylphenolicus]
MSVEARLVPLHALPEDRGWLPIQPHPVIAYGEGPISPNADVVVDSQQQAEGLAQRVQQFPLAALTLVQVLRATEHLPIASALDMESMAYSNLQTGDEFKHWLAQRGAEPQTITGEGDPILLNRDGPKLTAILNRPDSRNSMTVEMRDAWIEVLELAALDDSIESIQFSANGSCFSVGGELREFGSLPSPAVAHWVRSVRSPARMLAQLSERLTFRVHRACIGSGIELPAFAKRVIADRKTVFQLPELQLGLVPGAGGCVSIPRRIGRQRTAWMVLSGRKINAETALDWGLVDELRS